MVGSVGAAHDVGAVGDGTSGDGCAARATPRERDENANGRVDVSFAAVAALLEIPPELRVALIAKAYATPATTSIFLLRANRRERSPFELPHTQHAHSKRALRRNRLATAILELEALSTRAR